MLLFLGLFLWLALVPGLAPLGTGADEAQTVPVADLVATHRSSPNVVTPAENIRPGPASEPLLSYTDCEFDYRCYCQHRLSYRFQEVDAAKAAKIRDELERAAASPMFGCYETETDLTGKQEVRCRFVRELDMDRSSSAFKESVVPMDAGQKLKLWIEAAIRVDGKGEPVEEATARSLPILVEGNGKHYQAIQEFKARGPHCMMDVSFQGQVFDLSSCKDELVCLQRAFETYLSSLRHELSASPLVASEVHDQPLPPGEIWWQRRYQTSKILGPPNFENSSYRLRFWFAGDRGDYSTEPRKGLVRLYMNASETITSSVGVNGIYAEPSQEQVAAFKQAASASFTRALESACHDIHGQMSGSMCKF